MKLALRLSMRNPTELESLLSLLLSGGRHSPKSARLARRILEHPGPGLAENEAERAFFNTLESSSRSFLDSIEGMDESTRLKIECAFRIARLYSIHRESARRPKTFSDSLPDEALARIPEASRACPREWFGFVPVYRNGQVGAFSLIEQGTRTHVNLDPGELFARILAVRPGGFFLFHNHPSGDTTPSELDFHLTAQVKKVSDTLGIALLDHGIVSALGESWVSLVGSPHESHRLRDLRKTRRTLHVCRDPAETESGLRPDPPAPPGAG